MDLKKLDVMFEQNQDFMIYPNLLLSKLLFTLS